MDRNFHLRFYTRNGVVEGTGSKSPVALKNSKENTITKISASGTASGAEKEPLERHIDCIYKKIN